MDDKNEILIDTILTGIQNRLQDKSFMVALSASVFEDAKSGKTPDPSNIKEVISVKDVYDMLEEEKKALSINKTSAEIEEPELS